MKFRLERVYGPGLRDLHDEKGHLIRERLAWGNKVYQKLGKSLSIQIGPITLDAGGDNAYWLGFVQGMNYSLKPEGEEEEAGDEVALTNCFAATYAYLESVDKLIYNFATINDEMA